MQETYEIRDEYGTLYSYSPRSYDMACRVAFAMRKISGLEIGVVSRATGRYTSEVFYDDIDKDRYALRIARRLV